MSTTDPTTCAPATAATPTAAVPAAPAAPATAPAIFWMPDKFVKGAESLDDARALAMTSSPFLRAFQTNYSTDAHFVTYYVPGDDAIPRLTKPILSRIRLNGGDVACSLLVLDWDTPGHAPLTPALFDGFFASLVAADATFPPAMQWTLCYSTRNGARLVYIMPEPVTPERAEALSRGMVQELNARGVGVDAAVSDWTRLFRLPYVTRDRKPTWDDMPAPEFIHVENNHLNLHLIPEIAAGKVNQYAEIIPITRDKPDSDYCRKLLTCTNANGKSCNTDFYTQAKSRLRGRECFPSIFEMGTLAVPGSRDETIHRFVGQIIGLIYHMEETTAEHVYALLLDPVLQLDPDPDHTGGRTWCDILWSAVARLWAKEEAQATLAEAKAAERAEQLLNLASNVAAGMKNWCDDPALSSPVPHAFAARHMIAMCGNTCYLMRPDGTYDPTPLQQTQLIAAIRGRGMEGMIETTSKVGESDSVQDRPVQHLVNQYGTIVKEVIGVPSPAGGTIIAIDTPEARLQLPIFWRNEALKPEYNIDVALWIKKIAGNEYDALCRWIAYALAFEEGPICALSIKGKAGSGKKMLTQGLAECLRLESQASSEDLVGDNNYGLMESPFLGIDEGWVKGGRGRHPADQFRALVAGDPFQIKRKYFAPVKVINPVRVVFTANNLDAIRVLTHGRDLSPQDREALSVRLMHLDITDEASDWLRAMGGVKFTGAPGSRWIRGDGGEASDFIVAKHFLWLHERRRTWERGARFLVEGNANKEVLFELRTKAGATPAVIESIIKMLELNRMWRGMVVSGNRLYVSAAEILEYYRNNVKTSSHGNVTTDQVLNAIRGLSMGEMPTGAYVLPGRESEGPRRWAEIDCELLLSVAQKDGWACGVLQRMVDAQHGILPQAPAVVAGKIGERGPVTFFDGKPVDTAVS